jgi:hypothetical protein
MTYLKYSSERGIVVQDIEIRASSFRVIFLGHFYMLVPRGHLHAPLLFSFPPLLLHSFWSPEAPISLFPPPHPSLTLRQQELCTFKDSPFPSQSVPPVSGCWKSWKMQINEQRHPRGAAEIGGGLADLSACRHTQSSSAKHRLQSWLEHHAALHQHPPPQPPGGEAMRRETSLTCQSNVGPDDLALVPSLLALPPSLFGPLWKAWWFWRGSEGRVWMCVFCSRSNRTPLSTRLFE